MTQTIPLPPVEKMPVTSDSFFRWFGFFAAPHWKIFSVFAAIRVARYTVMSLMPVIIGIVINGFEQGWAFTDPHRLTTILGSYIVVYALTLCSIFVFFREAAAEDQMVRGMTLFSIRHMNTLPLPWHEAHESGGKLQRVMQARSSMEKLYDTYKWFLVPFAGGILAIFLSVGMLKAPLFFLLMYTGFIITFMAAALITAKPIPALHNRHNILRERLLSGVYEFVGAVRTVKAFHMGDYIQREAALREYDGHRAMRNVFRASYIQWTILNALGFAWMAAFIVVGLMGVYHRWLSIGSFTAIFFLASNLWNRLEEMVFIQSQWIEARNGFMRLTETLKVRPVSYDIAPIQPLPANWSALHFDHVDFTYTAANKDQTPPALHDITLDIRRGEKIALVGRSGAGKSTFVKLLMKQIQPLAGEIRVDSIGLQHIESKSWLSGIGFVPQDVELFNLSIRDNILLDKDYDACHEFYKTALRHAALDDLIASLPQGDQTLVGERGIKLSGGQRQRLGIARALVRNANLIIFDEATASLDSLSEQVIQNALATAFAGRTMVIIAHRLSTVRFADRIVVMEDGRMIENGSFDDLIARGGKFAAMWSLQSSGFVDGAPAHERPEETGQISM